MSPEQNNAGPESISQTVQKLLHFQIFVFKTQDGGHSFDNDQNVCRIKGISTLSKMTSVWSRYLKRFKSYSIFKCLSSEIQDGGR
jgi:hypothetical protein